VSLVAVEAEPAAEAPRKRPVCEGDFLTDGTRLIEVIEVIAVAGPNTKAEVTYLVQDARGALDAPPDLIEMSPGDLALAWHRVKPAKVAPDGEA
jgi:hypothetical protein